ncbi:hypothetical protein ACFQWA_27885 [Streptomyces thermogriseus]|uniref:Uncharacterized protein n=1 Tax=Streptomyces thermogriseus TaxID=75292 RepID=A0ABN1T0S0_9ACTN
MLQSFRIVLIPQCSCCGTAVTGDDSKELLVTERFLAPDLQKRLTAAGWEISPGDRKVNRGPTDPIGGDSLRCPACVAQAKRAADRFRARLAAPRVKTVDMTDRLGEGWKLVQRVGDADTKTWLVEYKGSVRGLVRRYKRVDGTWSTGWEALLAGEAGFVRHDATAAGSWSDRSSFLWSSRDLAAWGIAHQPSFHAPNPAWAGRSKRRK